MPQNPSYYFNQFHNFARDPVTEDGVPLLQTGAVGVLAQRVSAVPPREVVRGFLKQINFKNFVFSHLLTWQILA